MPTDHPIRPSYAEMLSADRVIAFWSRVNKQGPQGCWVWTGPTSRFGYGYFHVSRRYATARTHRVSWELLRGRIPDGLQLDHLCRNRACVNPDHLEVVTDRVNILRGVSPPAINARKRHCLKGHDLDIRNDAKGRWCVLCRKIANRLRKARYRKRAASAGLCGSCFKVPARDGGKLCERCREYKRAGWHRGKARAALASPDPEKEPTP